jgi:hypothetical protein
LSEPLKPALQGRRHARTSEDQIAEHFSSGCRGWAPRANGIRLRRRENSQALRTDDRIFVEIEESCFAAVAAAFDSKLGFCHGEYPTPDGVDMSRSVARRRHSISNAPICTDARAPQPSRLPALNKAAAPFPFANGSRSLSARCVVPHAKRHSAMSYGFPGGRCSQSSPICGIYS